MQKSKTYENNTIQCSAHAEKSLNFACLNKECTNVRSGCFKCMQDHHSEHLKEIKEFDKIKKDIKICLKESETIINQTLNFFEQALKYIQKIKEQFECSRELLKKFQSQLNRTETNDVIIELVNLKQGKYQQIVQKMMVNGITYIEKLKEQAKQNSYALPKNYNFGQQEQQKLQQEETILVNVVVPIQAKNLQLSISVDPEIPFVIFAEGIKKQIFSQKVDEKIEYSHLIRRNESKTLKGLGFTNGSTMLFNILSLQNDIK